MKRPYKVLELCRVVKGPMASTAADGMNGAFMFRILGATIRCVCSDGSGWSEIGLDGGPWEHVSVSLADRCPTWEEMCVVKNMFWGDDELVVQFHPPKKDHINCHPFCLHLWKPIGIDMPKPPPRAVGPRTLEQA